MMTITMASPQSKVGRPYKIGEVLSVDKPQKWAPSMWSRMEKCAGSARITPAELARRAVSAYTADGAIIIDLDDEKAFRRFVEVAKSDDFKDTFEDRNRFAERLLKKVLALEPQAIKRILSGQIADDLRDYETLKVQTSLAPRPMLSDNVEGPVNTASQPSPPQIQSKTDAAALISGREYPPEIHRMAEEQMRLQEQNRKKAEQEKKRKDQAA